MPKVKAAGPLVLCVAFVMSVRVATAAFEFERGGPRAAALGGAGVALAGDGWAGHRNPALAAGSMTTAGLGWSQQFGLPELAAEDIVAVTGVGTHSVGLSAGSFGSALYRESEFGLIWARGVRPGLGVGAHASLRRLDIKNYPSADAISFSAGVAGEPLNGLTLGAVWRNLNEPKLRGYRDRISGSLSLGIGVRIVAGGLLAAELVQEPKFRPEVRIGAELRLLPQLAVRVGGRAEPVRPSTGFQIDVGKWSFVYAGDLHPDLGASHQIGLEYRAGR